MNFGKMSKTGASVLLIILSIAILIIPAVSISYAETVVEKQVLTVQGSYTNGTTVDPNLVATQALPTVSLPIQTILSTSGNDTVLYGHRTNGTVLTRWTADWDNRQTYLGNGTYQIDVNYSSMATNYDQRMIISELDTTNAEWVTYDFAKIATDYDYTFTIYYQVDATHVNSFDIHVITTTGYLTANTLTTRAAMNAYPTGKIWIAFEVPDGATVDTQFTYDIEQHTLTGADALMWDDQQLYVMILLGTDMILVGGFIFTTNFVDIAFDRSKPKKPAKGKKW